MFTVTVTVTVTTDIGSPHGFYLLPIKSWVIAGIVDPWRVFQLIEEAYDYTTDFGLEKCGRDFHDVNMIHEGKLAFTVFLKLEFTENLYLNMNEILLQPVWVKMYLNRVGNSSLQILKDLYDKKGNVIILADI